MKYLNKVNIVEPCDSVKFEILILTAASHICSYVTNQIINKATVKAGISDIIKLQGSWCYPLHLV